MNASSPHTSCPAASKASHRCEPMNPAAPVTTHFIPGPRFRAQAALSGPTGNVRRHNHHKNRAKSTPHGAARIIWLLKHGLRRSIQGDGGTRQGKMADIAVLDG